MGKKFIGIICQLYTMYKRKEKLHLGNRVTNRHIHFQKSKMKVNLAVQVFSGSVPASLRYLSTDKSYKSKFKNVGLTADFIQLINNLFDILNSRSIGGKIYTQALHPDNFEFLSNYMDYCAKYIKALQIKKTTTANSENPTKETW